MALEADGKANNAKSLKRFEMTGYGAKARAILTMADGKKVSASPESLRGLVCNRNFPLPPRNRLLSSPLPGSPWSAATTSTKSGQTRDRLHHQLRGARAINLTMYAHNIKLQKVQ